MIDNHTETAHDACSEATSRLPGSLRSAAGLASCRNADPVAVGCVDLFWLPLGAGGHSVRVNGRVFESVAARLARRDPCDLYHSALEVCVPEGRFVIEQAPIPDRNGAARGVVAEGPVGFRWAAVWRLFRYEVRCWRDGVIPDVAEAVASPRRLTNDLDRARRLLELVHHLPTPVWGRDELRAGEMWNSNSITAWLVTSSGIDLASIEPPAGGRAPGWAAGLTVARRNPRGVCESRRSERTHHRRGVSR